MSNLDINTLRAGEKSLMSNNTDVSTLSIETLNIECDEKGGARIQLTCQCNSTQDVDDILAWLQLARDLTIRWEEIVQQRDPQ